MTEPLLTYGLSPDGLKSILDVSNGLACGCVCPKCSVPLVARNNPSNRKVPHFAHSSDNNCIGAYETALHMLAKEVLLESKKIRTPNFHHDYNNQNWESRFRDGEKIKFESVAIEYGISNNGVDQIIADAVGFINSKKLIIEFAKTHFVDEEKTGKLFRLRLPCIEIDLSNQVLDKKAIKKFLLSESQDIYWISNLRLDEAYKKEQEHQTVLLDKQKHINSLSSREKSSEIGIISQQNYERYKQEGKYKFFSLIKGVAHKCPIITEGLNALKSTRFYQHSILKRIVNGEYWNGIIYGNFGRDCYIYLQKDKVIIFPNDSIRDSWSEAEERSAKFFYAGLMEISNVIVDEGECNHCPYQADWLAFENRELSVCSHHLREEHDSILTVFPD
jgi:hypothetical protein